MAKDVSDPSHLATPPDQCNPVDGKESRVQKIAEGAVLHYSEERDVNFLWNSGLSSKSLQLLDRLAFMIGVLLLWVSSFWLANSKPTFHLLYAVLEGVMLTLRFWEYWRHRQGFYYLELCYIVNFLLIGFSLNPAWRNPALFKVLWAWVCGPVTWQMVVIKNECVFHSWDRMASMLIHWCPAMTMWVLRWYPRCEFWNTCGASENWTPINWADMTYTELVGPGMKWYFVWVAAWFAIMFVFAAPFIRKYELRTVYHWMMRQDDHPFTMAATKFPAAFHPLLYLLAHFGACLYGMSFSYLLWHSYTLHTSFLTLTSLICLWHGTAFYFGPFAQNYQHLTFTKYQVVNVLADTRKDQ